MADALRIYRRSELEGVRPTTDSIGCLHRYHAQWVLGVDDTSDPALIGIAFHSIQHAYVMALVEHKLGQDAELAQQAFVEGIAAAQTPSRLIPEVQNLWNWHAESFELSLERFVAAEERGAVGDVGFTPDLVLAHPESNILEIVDFKSGYHPPISEKELRGLFQARCYAKYSEMRWSGFSGYKFTLVAVRFRKSVSVVFTPSELDAVELEVRAAIATIEEAHRTNHWPATAGPSCHFCQLRCPIADQTVTLPKRITQDQAVHLGGWILVAEKQLRAAKKLLKATASAYGPIVVNGMEWADRPAESRSYPIDALIDVLKMRGVMGAFEDAAAQDLTISNSALSKLFKAYPDLENDLASVVKTKTTHRFSAKPTALLLDGGSDEGDEE